MAYGIELVESDEFVILHLMGTVSTHDFRASRNEVRFALSENGWSRLMVDARLGNKVVSVAEDFFFVGDLRSRLATDARIALLLRPDQVGESRFVENVARNRGLSLRLFEEKEKAVAWLLNR